MERIAPNRLDRGFYMYQSEFENAALRVLRSGWYILGEEVEAFEEEFAKYTGAQYSIGLASGLDALWLAFRILNIGNGDEVIVQANTYIASVMGITINGATPVFVEPNAFYNIDVEKIEEKITSKTKAILVVHLYGQAAKMDEVVLLCEKYNLKLVEDCAQAHGAVYQGKQVGTFGDIGCFSFYPSKNLGAFGDGGGICTNNKQIAEDFKIYRNYGSEKRYYNKVVGANSRLDEIQAALLRVRLKHMTELEIEKQEIAKRYREEITNMHIQKPEVQNGSTAIWHQYVIKTDRRDELQEYLNKAGIGTLIHYPIPPHLSEAYSYLKYQYGDFPITESFSKTILSIPMYNGMTLEEQSYVIKKINEFK